MKEEIEIPEWSPSIGGTWLPTLCVFVVILGCVAPVGGIVVGGASDDGGATDHQYKTIEI